MTFNLLDKERNLGHSSIMTGSNGGRRKSQMIGYRPFSAKMIPFRKRKFGKESFVWEQKSASKDMLTYSQTPGGSHAREKNL